MLDLRACRCIIPALTRRLPDVPDGPGAREVCAIAVGADHVGIEGEHGAGLADRVGAFLEPGIGALAAGEKPRFEPFAAGAGILVMKVGPEPGLGFYRE